VLKRIHINQHVIRRNVREDAYEPPIRIKTYNKNIPAYRVRIDGPAEVVYSPDRPLSCGARVWIETEAAVDFASTPETPVDESRLP
jgi:hypothetical protein